MTGMDRVALIGMLWFALWIGAGDAVGHVLFRMPGTGMVMGFIFAVLTVFLWPWVMPRFLEDWMHDPRA
jgi:hypothetical protein